jgi:hypothetical protein
MSVPLTLVHALHLVLLTDTMKVNRQITKAD